MTSLPKIPWWNTHIGQSEKDRLDRAFSERCFSLGPVAREFEERMASELGVRHVVVTPSGTAALTLAMLSSGVGPGDEIITADMTWVATGQAASILGANVVAADSLPDSPVLDVDHVEQLITERTKAIVPVHFHGRPCDMERLVGIGRERGIFIVEDACKAMLCNTPMGNLGTIGDFGCFSMGMISLVAAGYGGFIVTNDEEAYRNLLLMRDHGVKRYPEETYETVGFNFKISDLLLAIANGQLDCLEERKKHLRVVYDRYREGLANNEWIEFLPVDCESGIIPICVDLCSPHRREIVAYLEEKGVQCAPFHIPLHKSEYLGINQSPQSFPNSLRFSSEGFMPPCGPSQALDNVDHVIECLHEWRPGK